MPTSTDLVTDLPADFEVFGQAVDTSLADLKGGTTGQVLKKNTNADMDFVWSADSAGMTNPMTTTGDTIYSSSGSTPARLGIGSTGQVLTVAGGVPTWAAPGGGANWSLISSAALTGAGTITISGISNADQILVGISSASGSVSGSTMSMRFNSDTAANYNAFQVDNTNFASYNTGMLSSDSLLGDSRIYLANMSNTAGSEMTGYLYMSGCNASGLKAFHGACGGKAGGSSAQGQRFYGGYYNTASTISSVSLLIDSGNFDAGTIYVYKTA